MNEQAVAALAEPWHTLLVLQRATSDMRLSLGMVWHGITRATDRYVPAVRLHQRGAAAAAEGLLLVPGQQPATLVGLRDISDASATSTAPPLSMRSTRL